MQPHAQHSGWVPNHLVTTCHKGGRGGDKQYQTSHTADHVIYWLVAGGHIKVHMFLFWQNGLKLQAVLYSLKCFAYFVVAASPFKRIPLVLQYASNPHHVDAEWMLKYK